MVMIPNNDPVKAWALMLGLGYGIDKAKYPRTSVDVICATPAQYQMMLNRYEDLFSVRLANFEVSDDLPNFYASNFSKCSFTFFLQDPKKKQYVLNACKKRVRLMVSSMKPVPSQFLEPWRKATGHSILECYSTPEVRNLTF